MTERKYEWMGAQSYFKAQAGRIRAKESKVFGLIEARSTDSIVAKMVKAAEARRPRLRYVAPWFQGFVVRLARIAGA